MAYKIKKKKKARYELAGLIKYKEKVHKKKEQEIYKQRLLKTEKEADKLQKELSKWRGMTWKEAEKTGFGIKEKAKQVKLWDLGYRIVNLKTKIDKLKE